MPPFWQTALTCLVKRMAIEHPYHTMYQVCEATSAYSATTIYVLVRPSDFADVSIPDWIQGGILSLEIDDLDMALRYVW